jgi:hypothetical protein
MKLTSEILLGLCLCFGSLSFADETINFEEGPPLGNSKSLSTALGDLDGDGDIDAYVINFEQPDRIWLNNGSGTFTNSGQSLGNFEDQSTSVALADLDGDNDLDALVLVENGRQQIWSNDGNGLFIKTGTIALIEPTQDVSLGDIDGDGDVDAIIVALAASESQDVETMTLWINDGSGSFSLSSEKFPMRIYEQRVRLADLTGNGVLDIISNQRFLVNAGNENFLEIDGELPFGNNTRFDLGDVDGDGKLDVITNDAFATDSIEVFFNGPGYTFIDSEQDIDGFSPLLLDFDNDGDLDLYCTDNLAFNDGTGFFANFGQEIPRILGTFTGGSDFDGDGDVDLWVARGGSNISIPNRVLNHSGYNTVCTAGDLDGDGDFDEIDVRAGMDQFGIVEASACQADINGDGVVDGADLTLILSSWGICE